MGYKAQKTVCQISSLDNTLLHKISYTLLLLQVLHLLIPSNTWYNGWNTQFISYEVWSKTSVNAAVECDQMDRQGSSIREVASWTLVTVCDKFQLVRCRKLVVSYCWEKVCFELCCKSCVTNKALTWNFVANCKKVLKNHTNY